VTDPIQSVTLSAPPLTARILPFGATLAGLWHEAVEHSLVLGYRDIAQYRGDPFYLGALVGPLANRIAGARVQLSGVDWTLDANEGVTCLHGGSHGLSSKLWDIEAQEADSVTLGLALAHGVDGLPGVRQIRLCYRLHAGGLDLEIEARSDRDTFFGPAHHPYWRLDASGPVPRHRLTVNASEYLPTNDLNLPSGEISPLQGTPYDFRAAAPVPTDIPLDANLCLARARRADPAPAARLTASNGLTLTIETTEPGLQIYNGSGLFPHAAALEQHLPFQPFAGLALEPQNWPDAPNRAQFPSALLTAGALYRQTTRYRIAAAKM
jgi:aldose 1-epimerase